MSFEQQFEQHHQWRRQRACALEQLGQWLQTHDWLDEGARARLAQVQAQLHQDRVMVAFVAEFSRGKSELINAVFFAGYGQRIMPASAGRTTMCPTELGFDSDWPPCLRLLPIETRLQPQSLQEWRSAPELWQRLDLDVNQPAQLAQAIAHVAQTLRVPLEQARALGFWHDEQPEDNPMPGPDGLVEIPRWRHALINMAHPLLKQGLVIVDTPGLNAIGSEPELTVGLLPQAQAVVFVLAADAGVSKSDFAIWRQHLAPLAQCSNARLVVLNKIDTLWDELSPAQGVESQIERQCAQVAEVLGVAEQQVLALSAQKGLLAKVRQDAALLQRSQLAAFELALADDVLGQRRELLQASLNQALAQLRTEVAAHMQARLQEIDEQVLELDALRGKNLVVITQMRQRIEHDQKEFDASVAHIQIQRAQHIKPFKALFALLGSDRLKAEVAELARLLKRPGIKFGVARLYADTFARLRAGLDEAQTLADGLQQRMAQQFRHFNADYGFTLQAPQRLELLRHRQALDAVADSHAQYLGLSHWARLSQSEFCDRLAKAVLARLRKVFDEAANEVEIWGKTHASRLDVQLRERRRNFGRRIEAVQRIQKAAGALDERLLELRADQQKLLLQYEQWLQMCLDFKAADAPAQAQGDTAPAPAAAAT